MSIRVYKNLLSIYMYILFWCWYLSESQVFSHPFLQTKQIFERNQFYFSFFHFKIKFTRDTKHLWLRQIQACWRSQIVLLNHKSTHVIVYILNEGFIKEFKKTKKTKKKMKKKKRRSFIWRKHYFFSRNDEPKNSFHFLVVFFFFTKIM